jgi:exodeoxyribonuclease VII large subunit
MRAPDQPEILTVSQLTRRVKDLLEEKISYVWVSGELSNVRISPAGHAYFTIKDENSQIDGVMFRGKLMPLRFKPENGLEVIAFGLVTVYEKRGNYQIICEEMHPKGLGALQLAFEKLKKKLQEEGLFDEAHKKPLPVFPKRIGIVTSPTGAAIQDMLNVIRRRFANVHIILFPARVQGEEAAEEIVEGIRVLDGYGVDVIIVGRGGGSLEDLWSFNEEIVVRAVFEANTPIVSAVGHEIDFTLCDFAADVRAPTPSAAAELVVKEQQALVDHVKQLEVRMASNVGQGLRQFRNRLELAKSCYVLRRPEELVRQRRQQADELRMRIDQHMRDRIVELKSRSVHATRGLALLSPSNQVARARERAATLHARLKKGGAAGVASLRGKLATFVAQLDALSPLRILSSGYALARKLPELSVVHKAAELKHGDKLRLQFAAGAAVASVESIEETNHG